MNPRLRAFIRFFVGGRGRGRVIGQKEWMGRVCHPRPAHPESPWVSFLGFSEADGCRLGCFEVSVVGGLDFGGGAVVEFGVEALVVPPPDPFQGREFDLLCGAPGSAATDELGLVEPVDGFGRLVLTAAIVLVSALSTLTNPLYAGWMVLPAIVVLLALATMRLWARRSAVTLTVALIAGTLLGMMLRVPLAPWIVADGRNYLRPDRWNVSLAHYAELIPETLTTTAGAASLILMLTLWVASIGITVVAVCRRDVAGAFVGLCACLAPVITLTGAIAMGTEAARYLQPWAFMPALALTVVSLPKPMRSLSRRRPVLRVAPIMSTVVVLGMALASSGPRVIAAATAIDTDLRCVTDWIDASGRTGAGQFWTARAPKAYAADPSQVLQIDHQLNVYTWLTNRTDRIDADVTYLIIDANSYPYAWPADITEADAVIVECGRYTILDFSSRALPLGFSWP